MNNIEFFLLNILIVLVFGHCTTFTTPQPNDGAKELTEIPDYLEGTFTLSDNSGEIKIVLRNDKEGELFVKRKDNKYDFIPDAKLNLETNTLYLSKYGYYGDIDAHYKGKYKVKLKKLIDNQFCLNILLQEKPERWFVFIFKFQEKSDDLEVLYPVAGEEEILKIVEDSSYYKKSLQGFKYSDCEESVHCLDIEATSNEFFWLLKDKNVFEKINLERDY